LRDLDKRIRSLEERVKRLEERLNKLDPPSRFNSIEEYVEWRDSHGGGFATALAIKDGKRALRKLLEGVDPGEAQELMPHINFALRLEEKLRRKS